MISIDIRSTNDISKEIASVQKKLQQLPQESLIEFQNLTPIRTGNARRNTRLQGDTIVANYPYAQRLDQGASRQAPKGMTVPFDRWLQRKLKSIFGR
jgi:hypothetical protein